jgi:hypothetical protein
MAIAETALPGRLLSIQLWGVTIRWGKAKMWWEREEGKDRITRRRQRQKNKNEFRSPFLVVSFSLCDLIVMEHTALPWKMPFQLSLADETTNSRHNESRFFGRALFNNHRKNKKKMEK